MTLPGDGGEKINERDEIVAVPNKRVLIFVASSGLFILPVRLPLVPSACIGRCVYRAVYLSYNTC